MRIWLLSSLTLCLPVCSPVTRYISHVQNYINLVSSYTLNGYSTVDFPPLSDVNKTMYVNVDISLYAINDFDEVAGNIEIVAVLNMRWIDEMAIINSINFQQNDRDSFLVPYTLIWTPKLILTNAIGDSSEVGDPAYLCRFNMLNNIVTWNPRVVISGSCTPDVTFYPFDKQECEFIYTAWGFTSDELMLTTSSGTFDTSDYGESGEWDVKKTLVETEIVGSQSNIKFTLSILRKPLYFAFNILLPVLVLCLLNATVFLLPAESGERVGFSVTCFLTFVVLLNMIMDIMPRSSSPISFLCYYLVVMMGNSGAMTLVTIMLMRVYHKPEKSEVPKWLQRTVSFINCRCAKIRCCVACCRFLRKSCGCENKRLCGCRDKKVSDSQEALTEVNVIDGMGDKSSSSSNSVSTNSKQDTTRLKGVQSNVNLPKPIVSSKDIAPSSKLSSELGEPDVVTDDEGDEDSLANVEEEVSWAEVGRVCDTFFFLLFAGGQAFITVVFLVPLFTADTGSE